MVYFVLMAMAVDLIPFTDFTYKYRPSHLSSGIEMKTQHAGDHSVTLFTPRSVWVAFMGDDSEEGRDCNPFSGDQNSFTVTVKMLGVHGP